MPRGMGSLPELVAQLDGLPSGVAADVRFTEAEWVTMRFANGRIHQPHVERGGDLSLRVHEDGRLATATTSDLTPAGVAGLIRAARALAHAAPKEPKFPGFPAESGPVRSIAHATLPRGVSVDATGRLAADAIRAADDRRSGARISGVVHVGRQRLVVANTSGLAVEHARTAATVNVLVEDLTKEPAPSGWAERAHWDPRALDTAAAGRTAAERVARRAPEPAKPGKPRVVLRATAVGEMLGFLSYLGFNGHAELEGWSCLRADRGKRIAPASVTLTDTPLSAHGLPQAIDHEGLAKTARPLVDAGIARSAVMDLVTGGRLGVPSTAHGLPPQSPWGEIGPIPTQLTLAPGDASEEELIRETKRGILVTRFHYVRVVHPGQGMLTGMTRDGTYRIEDGEVVAPVRNLRFTESVLSLLRGVELLGRRSERMGDERGFQSITAPALAARAFRFTSATLF